MKLCEYEELRAHILSVSVMRGARQRRCCKASLKICLRKNTEEERDASSLSRVSL